MDLRLLLVDPDDAHRQDLLPCLRDDGFVVQGVSGLAGAVEAACRTWPHVVLTDLRYPDGTAEQLVHALSRRGELAFIVVSTDTDVVTRVRALDRFAEDFVARPYDYSELTARIRRVVRRSLVSTRLDTEQIVLGSGCWLDLQRREIHHDGLIARLTPTEGRLLSLFLLNPDRILPIDLILQRVWFDTPVGRNTLWEFIRRLRTKLGDDAVDPHYIVSARGIGYQFRREA